MLVHYSNDYDMLSMCGQSGPRVAKVGPTGLTLASSKEYWSDAIFVSMRAFTSK